MRCFISYLHFLIIIKFAYCFIYTFYLLQKMVYFHCADLCQFAWLLANFLPQNLFVSFLPSMPVNLPLLVFHASRPGLVTPSLPASLPHTHSPMKCSLTLKVLDQIITAVWLFWRLIQLHCNREEDSNEPLHHKTNKITQRRLRSAWAFAVGMKKHWALKYLLSTQWRLWSDWAVAQADLSLC